MFKINGFEGKWAKSLVPFLIIGVLLFIIALPFALPNSVYKDLLKSKLEEKTGLEFSIGDNFSLSLLPRLQLNANDILFNGTIANEVKVVGTLDALRLDMDLWDLLGSNINVEEFVLVAPRISVDGDFTPLLPDWVRHNLSAARKEDIRYSEIFQHFIEDSIFKVAKIEEGVFRWNKNSDTTIDVQKITFNFEKAAHNKDLTIAGNAYVNKRTVDIKMRLEKPDDFLRGYRSKMTFKIDSGPIRVEYDGSAAKRQTFVSQGDLRVDVPSLIDFCHWFKPQDQCKEKEGNLLVLANLKVRDQRLQIENATYAQAPFIANARGVIDFKSNRPEITGTVTLPSRKLKAFQPDFEALRGLDFDNALINALSANVDVVYKGVQLSSGVNIDPRIKVRLEDGRLVLSVDQLNLFGGLGSLRLRWHKGLENGYMDARLDLNGIALEKVQKEFAYNSAITGMLKTTIEVQSEGSTMVALMETATIRGDFSVLDGIVLNREVATSLNGRESDQFDFTELKGRIQGNRGQLLSDNIKFIAPSVDVSGIMKFDLFNDVLSLRLNSSYNAQGGENGGFVQIGGPLQDLSLTTSQDVGANENRSEGPVSGLIPNIEVGEDPAFGKDQIVIEESDLLD